MNEIIKKNGISFGIITGVVAALITATIYAIDLNLFTAWWVTVISITISITIAIVLLSKTKNELNGVFTFKDAFTTYFISAVIGIMISVSFSIILFNVIDPSAKDAVKEISIKYAVGMMEKFNTPTAAINEAVKKLQENDQFSIIEQLKGSVFSIVFSALFGLLLALVFKSKPSQE
ncbi:DUF4199 domain-containing protein [Flavobacterium cellulosilyticum]|uniref:DUF4199 domain-containing protein n=1 Tax=Flavobacterium cellulosilyticum TaxID=2541731 RepID=A0A4R5CBH9_9FLAO|nr:DUF4199 domain-containing protein [Flavobacterium cellulosilyticum]TDD94432.1 DUF4199 domain-containing protein [Flavobacterium cellulosilyticum]